MLRIDPKPDMQNKLNIYQLDFLFLATLQLPCPSIPQEEKTKQIQMKKKKIALPPRSSGSPLLQRVRKIPCHGTQPSQCDAF